MKTNCRALSLIFQFYFKDMDIYQRHTGRVLGPSGSTIKDIQARFGVKMNIHVSDSAKSGDETALNKLRVTGSFDGVRGAKQFVCYILNGGIMERYTGMTNGPPMFNNQSMGGMQMNNNNHSHNSNQHQQQQHQQQQQQQQYPYGGKSAAPNTRIGTNPYYYQNQNTSFGPPRNKFNSNTK